MPVHFNSFIADKEEELKNKLFSSIVTKYTQDAEDVYASDDKKKIHMSNFIREVTTNEIMGKVVITLIVNDEVHELQIVDVDITLKNDNISTLQFENKLDPSSEANEYWDVISEDGAHFQIETVNRYSLNKDTIVNTNQKVSLSVFPFQLDLYENEDELNKALGFEKPVQVADTGMMVKGFSSKMMAVGGVFTGKFNEPCSFIIGEIEYYRDVTLNIADVNIDFTIVYINTAIGIMPVATNRKNFKLDQLKKGNLLATLADVKADFKF